MPDERSSTSPLSGGVVQNPLPSRFSSTTIGSSGDGPSASSKASQPLAWAGSGARRPSASLSRRGSLASSSAPSHLPSVAEDGGALGASPPPPSSISQPHRPAARPGPFGHPPQELSLVEAALGGDLEAARAALARGELPGKRDAEGRDALLSSIAGWAVLRHFNPGTVVRMTAHEPPDPFGLFLELLPDPSVTLWTLNATYPVVQTGTLLTVASWLEKVDFVRSLLGETRDDAETTFSGLRGWVDPDGADARGGTGLMYAAVSGHIEIAQLLLSNGARPDRTEKGGLSAIWHATGRPQMTWLLEDALRKTRAKEHKEIASSFAAVTRLISLNPELYYSAPLSLDPPPVTFFESAKHASHGKNLLRAVKASDIASLEGLLFPLAPFAASEASLADPSVVEESDSALRSVPRRQGVVGLVNFVDENGLSPLHHALRTKPAPDLRIIKLLFAAGSDLNLACVSRSTPLHHLAYLGGSDQEVTRKNFQIRREREQAQTAGSEHQRTATAGASSSIQGTAALTGVPSPGKDLAIPSEASSGTVSDLPEVKIDDKEIFTLAGSEIEDELKAAITLLLHLGASPDIADCAGALPLHFAAEFGSSREIVRALLDSDLKEEERSLRARLELPQEAPERIPARLRQNGLGLTPRDLCRVEFIDLFEMAGEEAKARRKAVLKEFAATAGSLRPDDVDNALSRSPSSSYASSTASLPKLQTRDSILQPLPLITSLEEAGPTVEQICDNLLHIDRSLSSGLLLRAKEDLAQQNALHPEPDHHLHPSQADPIAEGITRLRHSFSISPRDSANRFRPDSLDSTQSSWWSQPSSCYSHNEIHTIRSELDTLYRLFSNTCHMAARVLQFYSDARQEEEFKLAAIDRQGDRCRESLAATAELIERLNQQKDRLRAKMEEAEADRHNRRILARVTDLAAAIVLALSEDVQGAVQRGAEDLDLVRLIRAAAAEAIKELETMQADISDIESSVAAEAIAIVDDHVGQVSALSADLVRSVVLPHKPMADKRQSFEPSLQSGNPVPRSPSWSSSFPATPTSSSFTSPSASRVRLPDFASPATTVSRGSGQATDECLPLLAAGEQPIVLPSWLTEARPRKEDQEEFVSARANIEEIDRDLRDVESSLIKAEQDEALTQAIIDQLPKKAPHAAEADERREAFRLMSVIYARIEQLRRRRAALVDEHGATMSVLERFREAERQQDNTSRLSSLLRLHAYPQIGETPPTMRVNEYEPVASTLTDEVTAWLDSMPTAPRRDMSHFTEASVAWDLRKVALRVEGADSLLARMSEDVRLVRQEMDQNRSRCARAEKHLTSAQAQLASYLQWRMDSLIVLWEWLSSDSSDERSSLSGASSWILDARDRLVLPNLICDPLPLQPAATPNASPQPDSRSATAAHGGPTELATIQRKLRRDVHEPLAQARAEVARTSDWCRILDQTKDRLDVRLRGD